MNIRDKFVFIHMPKTGGTFVSHHVKDYVVRPRRGFLERVWPRRNYKVNIAHSKHARRVELLPSSLSMPLVGCIRNPFDWYVSNYTFEWWKDYPEEYPGVLEHKDYPNLSFSDYLDLSFNEWFRRLSYVSPLIQSTTGRYTQLVIWWFCKNPEKLLGWEGDIEQWELQVRNELNEVRFLKTDSLNEDLSRLLEEYKFPDGTIEKVRQSERIYPSQHKGRMKQWLDYYSDANLSLVFSRDKFIFEHFGYEP